MSEGQDSCKMAEENLFFTKLTESYILTCADYEDSNRLFPIKKDTRNLMRTCERCSVSFDLNSPSGRCCYHKSFFKLLVPEQHVAKIVGQRGKNVQEIKKTSGVSHLNIAKHEATGRFKGEVQLQGRSYEIERASSMIRSRLEGIRGIPYESITGSWACCNNSKTDAEGCTRHVSNDCYLDISKVLTTRSVEREERSGKVYALDCEMVITTRGKELARVTMLDFGGEVVFEELVKPGATIVDYNTAYSGITKETLLGVSTTLEDVQRNLLQLVTADDILVGHGLDHDLRCLHMEHRKVTSQKNYVLD